MRLLLVAVLLLAGCAGQITPTPTSYALPAQDSVLAQRVEAPAAAQLSLNRSGMSHTERPAQARKRRQRLATPLTARSEAGLGCALPAAPRSSGADLLKVTLHIEGLRLGHACRER